MAKGRDHDELSIREIKEIKNKLLALAKKDKHKPKIEKIQKIIKLCKQIVQVKTLLKYTIIFIDEMQGWLQDYTSIFEDIVNMLGKLLESWEKASEHFKDRIEEKLAKSEDTEALQQALKISEIQIGLLSKKQELLFEIEMERRSSIESWQEDKQRCFHMVDIEKSSEKNRKKIKAPQTMIGKLAALLEEKIPRLEKNKRNAELITDQKEKWVKKIYKFVQEVHNEVPYEKIKSAYESCGETMDEYNDEEENYQNIWDFDDKFSSDVENWKEHGDCLQLYNRGLNQDVVRLRLEAFKLLEELELSLIKEPMEWVDVNSAITTATTMPASPQYTTPQQPTVQDAYQVAMTDFHLKNSQENTALPFLCPL